MSSVAELLDPVPNSVAILAALDANRKAETGTADKGVQVAQWHHHHITIGITTTIITGTGAATIIIITIIITGTGDPYAPERLGASPPASRLTLRRSGPAGSVFSAGL